MQTIGIIGGMSWYSTREYYGVINSVVQGELGGHHSARIVLSSLDFDDVRRLQVAEDWQGAGELLADHACRLESAGADFVMIGTNLMHKVAPAVEAATTVPLLHIGDAVADVARRDGYTTLGILGARWVMEEPFYAERLAAHGIGVVVPGPQDRALVDGVVFDEITQGIVTDSSRAAFCRIMRDLRARGAEAVVLACTEIEALMAAETDPPLPMIDSMSAHASYAARMALGPRSQGDRVSALPVPDGRLRVCDCGSTSPMTGPDSTAGPANPVCAPSRGRSRRR